MLNPTGIVGFLLEYKKELLFLQREIKLFWSYDMCWQAENL